MKKHFVTAATAFLGVNLLAIVANAGNADPVLMNINGKDVRVSEFEYLYNKNSSQQLNPQPLDEYIKMFIDYKLKVADAEAAGIDTTAAFIDEYTKFRDDLARPYLRDKSVEDKLVEEAYGHYKYDVLASHIMMPADENSARMLDSIRTDILSGKTTFEAEASKHSVDRSTKNRGGQMGYIVPGRFPWAFEKAAYETAVGGISDVINSGFGNHIIRIEKRTDSRGEVLVEHILRLTQGLPEDKAVEEKNRIDSIYNAATTAGANFNELAKLYSQDPGSAQNGGKLNWFGTGVMVAEFDSISFAISDGEISKPFKTSYGYHIVHKLAHRDTESIDKMRPEILRQMLRDSRSTEPERAKVKSLLKQYNAKIDASSFKKIKKIIAANGGDLSSEVISKLADEKITIAKYAGKKVMLAEALAYVPTPTEASSTESDVDAACSIIEEAANNALEAKVLEKAREDLAATTPEYKNLINEYRDGILLYEISNRNVWDKAAKDTDGLEKFFAQNKDNYKWDKPRFKSFVIFAKNDSLLALATEHAKTISTDVASVFTKEMHKRFGRSIKIERVIAAKGENAITDYLAFGGNKPESDKHSAWQVYAAYNGRIIEQPEEASDVRGTVITDYQAELEKAWLEKIRSTYPVKIKEKELSKLKDRELKK